MFQTLIKNQYEYIFLQILQKYKYMKHETLGKRIKDLRVDKKLTQEELSQELNIDKSTIAKYETDKIAPSIPMLIVLAKFFEVSTDYLLGLED